MRPTRPYTVEWQFLNRDGAAKPRCYTQIEAADAREAIEVAKALMPVYARNRLTQVLARDARLGDSAF